jgi:hypothetical protein
MYGGALDRRARSEIEPGRGSGAGTPAEFSPTDFGACGMRRTYTNRSDETTLAGPALNRISWPTRTPEQEMASFRASPTARIGRHV